MIKRILHFFGLIELVWTQDFSGAVRLRKVYVDKARNLRLVRAILTSWEDQPAHILESNGTVRPDRSRPGHCRDYIANWYPYSEKPEEPRKGWK